MPTVLTVDEARALVTTSLSDDDLEDVIDREEDWLARRIGPLVGERVETYVPALDETLLLTRPTDLVTVTDDDGDRTDVEVRPWSDIVIIPEGSWSGTVTVTYTPDDENLVRKSLITLVRHTVAETAYVAQAAGPHSVQYDPALVKWARRSAWRSLLRPAIPTTTRLRGSRLPDPGPIASVGVTATGS